MISALLLSSGNSEAGCNGSCNTIEGEDWVVDLDTHMWNENIVVNDLIVNSGGSLKLENVTIDINGYAYLSGKTE